MIQLAMMMNVQEDTKLIKLIKPVSKIVILLDVLNLNSCKEKYVLMYVHLDSIQTHLIVFAKDALLDVTVV